MLRSSFEDLKGEAKRPPFFNSPKNDSPSSVQRVRKKGLSYVSDLGLAEEIKEILFSGKMLRSHLSFAAGACLDAPRNLMEAVACSVEMVHESSLCHDDIQDSQAERRKKPTIWKILGVNQAINFGDLLTSLSYRPLLELKTYNSQLLVNHLNQVIAEVIRGQILEQQHLGQSASRAFYERVASLKTGALIAAGPQLICLAMGQTLAMQTVTMAFQHLSLAFQLFNDLSLVSKEGMELDFQNKVFSFPFIILQERLIRNSSKESFFELCSDYQKVLSLFEKYSVREEILQLGQAHLRLFREKLRQLGDEWPSHFDPLINRYFKSSFAQ